MKQTKGIKILQVRCLLCHETLRYSRDYTRPLIEHLKRRHPYINIARLPSLPDSADQLYMRSSVDALNASAVNSSYVPAEKESTWQFLKPNEKEKQWTLHNLPPQTSSKLSVSIPTSKQWLIGSGRLLCTRCGILTDPVIEKKNYSNYSAIGKACFMLWCWPFSYMAYNLCADNIVKLYCRKCSTYLATYDLKDNKIVHQTGRIPQRNIKTAVVAKLSTSAPSINIHSKSWERLKPEELPLSHSFIK